ncbi:MAG: dTDP-4-dehydrorhamnose 3,5-epimerase [Alphaproteobacteria bacterium]|nr:dTDP-4-dehydrorhamnose 3,5-epimerase [Alphaproteobacteria bacterium]MDZ4762527.1 dTDP-4-dehydrorhamnose 3,5-epimerase [Alphaproteobacteria bacterium]
MEPLSPKRDDGKVRIERLALADVFLYRPRRLEDRRGFFCETFNQAALETVAGPLDWVQDNQSSSNLRGVLRGLHFQLPPFSQDKLVRCVRGTILDVAVDLRHGSPTFGRHAKALISADGGEQIFVPKGFAHGFLTLDAGCEVLYKVTSYYSAEHDRCIRWNDPALAIEWGVTSEEVILSERDAVAPLLSETPACFVFGG